MAICMPALKQLRICSTVFAVRFPCSLNLGNISATLRGRREFSCRYAPDVHPSMTVRSKDPKAILILFSDGHGLAQASSDRLVRLAVKRFSRISKTANPTLRLVNIVVSGSMEQPVDLDRLSLQARECVFEPEQFSGAMIRIRRKGLMIGFALVFSSGKFTLLGVKRYEDIQLCVRELQDLLMSALYPSNDAVQLGICS